MGATWYVVGFVVVILRYGDCIWPFARVRRARNSLSIVSPQQGVSGGEGCKSKRHCGGGSQRPRQKCASRAFRLFLKFLIQTLVKTIGRSENPFIAVDRDKIGHSVEQRGAVATLGTVPLKRPTLRRIHFVPDIVRNIPPDVLAVHPHRFPTSFNSRPTRPPSP